MNELVEKLAKVEKDNRELKRSVYDLSMTVNQLNQLNATSSKKSMQVLESLDISKVLARNSSVEKEVFNYTEKVEEQLFHRQLEFRGHTGAVYTVQFSKCGRYIASGSMDRKVLLWDVTMQEKNQLAVLQQHTQLVIDLDWSSDSKHLVSASYDRTVKKWDIEVETEVHSILLDGFLQTISYHALGKYVSSVE